MAQATHPLPDTDPPGRAFLPARAAATLALAACTYVAGVHFTRTVTPG